MEHNSAYIQLHDGATLTVAYADEKNWMYTYGGEIAGAASAAGKINDNHVYILGTLTDAKTEDVTGKGTLATGIITGGTLNVGSQNNSFASELNRNSVVIQDAVITAADAAAAQGIFGAYTYLGIFHDKKKFQSTANGNTVSIANSKIATSSIGAFLQASFTAAPSSVEANDNVVEISRSVIDFKKSHYSVGYGLYGASNVGENGTSSGNLIHTKDSQLNVDLASENFVAYSVNFGNVATGNHIVFENTDLNLNGDGYLMIQGARSQKKVDGNSVEFINTKVLLENSAKVDTISAAYIDASLNLKKADAVIESGSNNVIRVVDSELQSGALIAARYVTKEGVDTSAAHFDGNTVEISNSKYGGSGIYAVRVGSAGAPRAGTANNNRVIIGENVTEVDGSTLTLTNLYGAYGAQQETTYSGNTLALASQVVTSNFGGFQNFQFDLNDKTLSGGAILSVTGGPVVLATKASEHLGGETSKIVLTGKLPETGEIELINSTQGFQEYVTGEVISAGALNLTEGQALEVNTIESVIRTSQTTIASDSYELSIRDNGTVADPSAAHDQSLVITIDQTEPGPGPGPSGNDSINDQTNTLVESSLSALATAFAADDLFVDTVLRSRDGKRDGLFAAARAGMYSYDTNTRLETNIVSGLVGFSASVGDSNVGAFLEMGHASYDSRLNSSLGQVRGQGSHNYAGVGIFADYALPVEGWRLTGYVKGGSLNNDFSAMIAGVDAGYDKTSAYWGAHLGTHYDIDMPSMRTRVFASYFYDGRESESYDIAGTADVEGAHVKYDSLNAHRVQFGSMFEFKMSDTLRPYLGLTFEQIISAEAEGTATDAQGTMKLNSSDLEGSTGILSAGWTYMNEPGTFSCEFGLNGYAGTRNGVSGQLQGTWKF